MELTMDRGDAATEGVAVAGVLFAAVVVETLYPLLGSRIAAAERAMGEELGWKTPLRGPVEDKCCSREWPEGVVGRIAEVWLPMWESG